LRALFLTWDGPQQSYLESLFFPIFSGLSSRGVSVHTLQLTWATSAQLEPVRQAAERRGTPYCHVRIPAPLRKLGLPAVMALGAASAVRYARRHGIQTLMPRSLLPMGMALLAERAARGLDLVFEADGLMADERVDFGGWDRRGARYRLLRRIEAQGVRRSRSVVCRTQAARDILLERVGDASDACSSKVFVVPNAKDTQVFAPGDARSREQARRRHGIPADAPWAVHVGSIGPQYLPELTLAAMARLRERRPDTKISFFTFHQDALRPLLARHGLEGVAQVNSLSPSELPAVLAAADLGFAPRLEAFSQRGICPIKVAEYLLCGLPVVTSRVGDLAQQLGDDPAVMLVDGESRSAAEDISNWFVARVLPERAQLRERARALGLRWFDLSSSVEAYERILRFGRPSVP
jgi:glycosyltransferase involved in cell wall biosynthesis